MATEIQHSFFEFTMRDSSTNEVDLGQFQNKDLIFVVNSKTQDECEERAPLYYSIQQNNSQILQILCIECGKFFWDSQKNYDGESKCLTAYLKNKSNCTSKIEDGLCFLIDNRAHQVENERVHYLGLNLTAEQVAKEIKQFV